MPTSDCAGLYVSRWTSSSFTVREVGGGKSNASFNWEVAAQRKDCAGERLQPLEEPSR